MLSTTKVANMQYSFEHTASVKDTNFGADNTQSLSTFTTTSSLISSALITSSASSQKSPAKGVGGVIETSLTDNKRLEI